MVEILLHLWSIFIIFMVFITFMVDFYYIYGLSVTFMVIKFMGGKTRFVEGMSYVLKNRLLFRLRADRFLSHYRSF